MGDLAFAGVAEQARLIRSGEISSRELCEATLARITEHNPSLNAFKEIWVEQALRAADQADQRRSSGEGLPLRGVPIAVKDDMDVAGSVTGYGAQTQTTAASADAAIVRILREAGAVLVGKTHVPELMTMPFTETLWHGATRNPWDLDRTPGGSSGGSAAAVAAGLVGAATASDGAGSIRIPAVCCGLVGLKATSGRVPSTTDWNGLVSYGFLSRRTTDAALLQSIVDPQLGPLLQPGRLRIAVTTTRPFGARRGPDETVLAGLTSMAETLRALGHEVFEADLDLGASGLRTIARYLRGVGDAAADVENPDRLGGRTRALARIGGLIPDRLLRSAVAAAPADARRMQRIYERADVVMTPVLTRLPFHIGELDGYGALRALDASLAAVPYAAFANHVGTPAIALPAPATTADGFVLGVQVCGPRDCDALLLGLAAQVEEAVGWPDRRPPAFDT